MGGWIKVKDSKPAKKVTVLVVVGIGKQRHIEMACYGHTAKSGDWWSIIHMNVIPGWSVTHWQPLPDLPPEV